MIRAFTRRSSPSLLEEFLRRRAGRAEGTLSASNEGDRDTIQLGWMEFLAAATVLDFGGMPLDMPTMPDRTAHDGAGQ